MDHILYWNGVALEANRRDFSNVPGTDKPSPEQGGPTLSSRAMAIVHLAMYDAHAGVVGGASLPRYLSLPPGPGAGASAAAAVAAAAHACLSALYPRQKPHFDLAHQAAGLSGAGLAQGHAFGLAVAAAMLADRASDPSPSDNGYAASMHPGGHRPDPANPGQGYHAPFYGKNSKLFAATALFGLNAPPTIGSPAYESALDQVRGKGIAPELMGTLPATYSKRTVDETAVGLYWAYDGPRELGTPPRLYNQIVREVAMAKGNNVDQNARLFALVNAALGDAGILAWREKYIHDVWRPVVGIREHDPSMGPAAPMAKDNIDNDCDPEWLPFGAPHSNSYVPATGRFDKNFTPPFPAYPSGHATFGAAALHMVRLFYGVPKGDCKKDDVYKGPFVSDEMNGVTQDNQGNVRPRHLRKFDDGLWQMIEENGFSRVYLGVHWFFDAFALKPNGKPDVKQNIGGVPLGLKIAEDIFMAGMGKAPKKSTVLPLP
ncbi:MAG: phosphatase PAP2 family protein [Nitrospira sp.]|nr:MAG: phosphatase PAP2 family protein [Nitrospira sp.]